MDTNEKILRKSFDKAVNSGISGASAMAIQVTSLMWLRTTMNYQYRYGTTTTNALKSLYKEGGILRFYRGYLPALLQAPISRFGDTAANMGMNTYLNSNPNTKDLPIAAKTLMASMTAGIWRIFLMPIDTTKTIMQVEGKNGLGMLGSKIKKGGPGVLYHGALGAYSATVVGHFPWFYTYNILDDSLPKYDTTIMKFIRNGGIGFTASVVSDCSSNSLRVIKTTKQTFDTPISYKDTVNHIIKNDGIKGLFGRGLKTRIITNGIQGCMFTVLWKYFQEASKK
ncbi:Mitochondrial carrier protein [seawater metagenome]|uniref:Mitochondrial carrier protein n=1 Tax=seawater metagenome TaxID=1561972 RepID=A0A5E8CHG8_9ZZZZ